MKKNDHMIPFCRFFASKRYLKTVMTAVILLLNMASLKAVTLSPSDKLSFTSQQMTIEQVFDEISTQLKCDVFYSENQLDAQKLIRLPRLQMTLDETLQFVLADKYSYTIEKNAIVIASRPTVSSKKVSGTVKDEKGESLPGVTILLKGTTTGVTTDLDGNYSLVIPGSGDGAHLIFSFVGMQTQEVVVNKDVINIVMKMDVNEMDEVVITGYQVIDKKKLTSAVSTVKAKDVMIPGAMSIDQMLQGVIPGMSVVNRTGKVGGSPKIRIRGTSTLLGNQEPLWVVDGVIQTDPLPLPDDASPISSEMDGLRETASNAISWLNPADIETITVLKDASATAIYGTRATNGVIVITTKKAKGDGLNISYSGNFSVGMKPSYRMYDMMNSQEHMRFSRELWEDRDSYNQNIQPIGYAGLIQKLQKKERTESPLCLTD